MTNKQSPDNFIPSGRATGRTFRAVCMALSRSSGGERIMVIASPISAVEHTFHMAVHICRVAIPPESIAGDIDIKRKDRAIIFPGGGIFKVKSRESCLKSRLGEDPNFWDATIFD